MVVLTPTVEPRAAPVDVIFPTPCLSSQSLQLPEVLPACGLFQLLVGLPDPRRRRGVRHGLAGIVAVALAAVLAAARSYAAIGQWAAELTAAQLAEFGLDRPAAPEASTFRRVFAGLDAGAAG
jgi:hypothetical protein